MLKNNEKIGQNPMMRSFSELTKDFDPERRERIEQRKEEIRRRATGHSQQVATPVNSGRTNSHHG
jgi:hypothetical protein